jgi:hypothetical protein
MHVPTVYGVITLEAKWIMSAGAIHADVAKDPGSYAIAVTMELREHAIARVSPAAGKQRHSCASQGQHSARIGQDEA